MSETFQFPPPEGWDSSDMFRTLLDGNMTQVMRRTVEYPPQSPLFDFVEESNPRSNGRESPALSLASEDSLDSILTASASGSVSEIASLIDGGDVDEELDTNQLIYRLCRSLYRRARQKTEGHQNSRSRAVAVDGRSEFNMSRVTDWMPLLHLFDPKSFYAYRDGRTSLSGQVPAAVVAPGGSRAGESPFGPQRSAVTPREASASMMDELQVEKLSGGNSNHVYRLGHHHFPDKIILLRVYGGGADEAIDRYRDGAAMKEMSAAKLAPAVLHSFKWGRVEEFMEDVATGTTDMLIDSPILVEEVYTVLHEMHQLPADAFFPQSANKARFKRNAVLFPVLHETYAGPDEYLERNGERLMRTVGAADSEYEAREPYYRSEAEVKVMEEICPTAFERASLRFLRLTSPFVRDGCRGDFVRFMTGEVAGVRGYLRRLAVPVVFAHNDLNPANILFSWRKVPKKFRPTAAVSSREEDDRADDNDEVTSVVSDRSSAISRRFLSRKGRHRNLVELKGIVFIDFEYADANYRAIDLGNTIYELDYDYTRGMGPGEPGFIKYLHTFPPSGLEVQWADKPEHYPRLPELIYMAWRQQQQEEGKGEGEGSAARCQSLGIGSTCLRALSRYFRLCACAGANGSSAAAVAAGFSISREELVEVFLGMLATQLHWALWSFTFACNRDTLTNQTVNDDTFAKGSSGLDYLRYGDCRLKEYLSLKAWMAEHDMI